MAVAKASRTYMPLEYSLTGPVNELADFGEGFDGGQGALDLGAAQTHDLAVQEDVLAAAEFGIEAGAQFEQRGDAPARDHAALRGLQDAADDLQQRAFAAAVRPDQAQHLALFHRKLISRSAQKSVCRRREGQRSRRRSEGRRYSR